MLGNTPASESSLAFTMTMNRIVASSSWASLPTRRTGDAQIDTPEEDRYVGTRSRCPGKMRSGSLTTCWFAAWMRGHLLASP